MTQLVAKQPNIPSTIHHPFLRLDKLHIQKPLCSWSCPRLNRTGSTVSHSHMESNKSRSQPKAADVLHQTRFESARPAAARSTHAKACARFVKRILMFALMPQIVPSPYRAASPCTGGWVSLYRRNIRGVTIQRSAQSHAQIYLCVDQPIPSVCPISIPHIILFHWPMVFGLAFVCEHKLGHSVVGVTALYARPN